MRRSRKKAKLELDKKQYPFDIKKYLTTRNLLLLGLLLVFYIFFPQYVQPIILIAILYPISLLSIRSTKYVKYLNTEIVTPFTIFIGYVYGWQWAIFYGFFLGFFMWAQSSLNTLTMINCLTYVLSAFLGYWASLLYPGAFMKGYLIAVTIRNVITFFVFLMFNPDPLENLTHTFAAFMTNTIILPLFLNMLYNFLMLITI